MHPPKGTHIHHPAVRTYRGRVLTIEASGQTAYADGERIGPLPVEIDVRRLRALPQAGCSRLEVTTRQRAVLVDGQRRDQQLVYQLSFCADGRFPEER